MQADKQAGRQAGRQAGKCALLNMMYCNAKSLFMHAMNCNHNDENEGGKQGRRRFKEVCGWQDSVNERVITYNNEESGLPIT